jgi:hypothetical protein
MSDEQQVDDTDSAADAAMEAVKGPALGLVIFSIIGLLFGLVGLLMNFGFVGIGVMESYGGAALMAQGGFGAIQSVIGLGISVFIYMAAKKMERLENFNWAIAGSILAMLPCFSPCCVLGLPVGIWALVVLNKPEVKGAFTVTEA